MSRDELRSALDELSAAHGAHELAAAHASLQSSIRRKRNKIKTATGPLATAIEQCIEIRHKMKRDGVTGDALNAGIETVLRHLWPRQRTEPWHYVCENCRDYGAEYFNCPAVKCDRDNPHDPHEYMRPCWCEKGRRFREKQAPTEADAMERAAKPRKPSGFFKR